MKMGQVYTDAYVTLAAASASSVHERILGPRPAKWQGYIINIPEVGSINYRRLSFSFHESGRDVGPIAERAWTMQERYLSTCLLTYTEAAVKLECLTCLTMECQMPRAVGPT
jgi:hypothetical protein